MAVRGDTSGEVVGDMVVVMTRSTPADGTAHARIPLFVLHWLRRRCNRVTSSDDSRSGQVEGFLWLSIGCDLNAVSWARITSHRDSLPET